MFGSTTIEIAIGLVFIYLVLSIICTSANEYLAQILSLRGENLYEAVHGLFGGPDQHRFAEDIFNHSQVASLSRKSLGVNLTGATPGVEAEPAKPSSIPATAFSAAVTDLIGITEPAGAATSAGDFTDVLTTAPYDAETLKVLSPLINAANNNLDKARKNIEDWFDMAMQRATGWYKRKAQVMTFLVAFGVVFIANADTIVIFDRLWANPTERTQIEALAKNTTSLDAVSESTKKATTSLLGWTVYDKSAKESDPRALPHDAGGWFIKLVGLLISAFAVSLGAPFWFDRLQTLMNIRNGGKPANAEASGQTHIASSDA